MSRKTLMELLKMTDRTIEGNFDLYLVLIFDSLFLLFFFFFPSITILRVVMGIPFLLFLPGYALISLIFVIKYQRTEIKIINNKKEKHVTVKEKPTILSKMKNRFFPMKNNDLRNDSDFEEKGLRPVMRFILSVILSFLVIPLMGWGLNELYVINNHFGIRPFTLIYSVFLLTIVPTIFAIIRRRKTPKEIRFKARFDPGLIIDGSKKDRIITFVLVAILLISIITGFYLNTLHNENEKFTEFYLLGPEKTLDGYPEFIIKNTTTKLFFGVRNHEFQKEDYTLRVFLDEILTIDYSWNNLSNLNIKTGITYAMKISLYHDDRIEQSFILSIDEVGVHKLHFELLKDGKVYRDLYLNIMVASPGFLRRIPDTDKVFLLTDSNMAPLRTPLEITAQETFSFGILVSNDNDQRESIHFTIGTVKSQFFLPIPNEGPYFMDEVNGTYVTGIVDINSRVILPVKINLPSGNWTLIISLRDEPSVQFILEINVY